LEALREKLVTEGAGMNRHPANMVPTATTSAARSAPVVISNIVRNGDVILPPPSGKGCSSSSASSTQATGDDDKKKDDAETLEELVRYLSSLPDIPTKDASISPLQDRFGRHHNYLRISLAEKCNLRCLYCMPEQGVPLQPPSHLLTNSEILQLVEWFVANGVTKIRLTGGEPLLRKDLVELITDMQQHFGSQLEQIGMTTNGVSLSRSKLEDLVTAGLTHVNLSLDSLHADTFAHLTRRPPTYHGKVMQALYDCAEVLPHRTKINVVVMPTNVQELYAFGQLSQTMPVDVRFIEYMPFNDNQWATSGGFISYQAMQDELQRQFLVAEYGIVEASPTLAGTTTATTTNHVEEAKELPHVLERLEDGPNDTTKWWGLSSPPTLSSSSASSPPPPQGRIGFITSMSQHFCSTCNRLRLTADGKLKVCLFGKTEVNLRDLLRRRSSPPNDEEDHPAAHDSKDTALLQKVIHYAVQQKHYKLGGHADMMDLAKHSDENRPMTLIGG
jgi:molybdenum cofactor biosynthesis enzyme MoaA